MPEVDSTGGSDAAVAATGSRISTANANLIVALRDRVNRLQLAPSGGRRCLVMSAEAGIRDFAARSSRGFAMLFGLKPGGGGP
jgi:hypothetical protein